MVDRNAEWAMDWMGGGKRWKGGGDIFCKEEQKRESGSLRPRSSGSLKWGCWCVAVAETVMATYRQSDGAQGQNEACTVMYFARGLEGSG